MIDSPEVTSRKSAPRSRPGGRTQRISERIFAATLQILSDSGYAGLSFQNVAEAAGVNRTTIYRRWESRAMLTLDAVEHEVRAAILIADTGSFRGDIENILRQIGKFLGGPLGSTVLAAGLDIKQSGDTQTTTSKLWATRAEDIAPIFARALARGEITTAFDQEAAFAMLAGSLYFRFLLMMEPIDEAWIKRVTDSFPFRS